MLSTWVPAACWVGGGRAHLTSLCPSVGDALIMGRLLLAAVYTSVLGSSGVGVGIEFRLP